MQSFVFIYRSDSTFTPENGIIGRVDEYPNDVTVLTVPYNSGIIFRRTV